MASTLQSFTFRSMDKLRNFLKIVKNPTLFALNKSNIGSKCTKYNTLHRQKIFMGISATTIALMGGGIVFFHGWQDKPNFSERFTRICTVHATHENKDDVTGNTRSKSYNFIADVVELAAPAVVYIEIQSSHPFHGRSMPVSNGSGFIVRENGVILTNAHVVANKQSVKVKLQDGRVFDGSVQAVDPVSDLATIKIEASNLPTLTLGSSSNIRTGEWVIAMGSPLSLSNTVTTGVISNIHRGSKELGIHNKDMDYIQTDAVINFGNSGGPLVNLDGEAIGINTMKVTTGISFAIPSDYASEFLKKADEFQRRTLSKKGGWFGFGSNVTKQKYMGLTMLTLTNNILMELKERVSDFPDIEKGVLIYKVTVGSPAYNGGLVPGDVVTKINGKEVECTSDVYKAVQAEDILNMTVYRKNQIIILSIRPENVN